MAVKLLEVRIGQGSRSGSDCHTSWVRVDTQSWMRWPPRRLHVLHLAATELLGCIFVSSFCARWVMVPRFRLNSDTTHEGGRWVEKARPWWPSGRVPKRPLLEVWENWHVPSHRRWKGFLLHWFPSWLLKCSTFSHVVGWVSDTAHTCLLLIGIWYDWFWGHLVILFVSFPLFSFSFQIFAIVFLLTGFWNKPLTGSGLL